MTVNAELLARQQIYLASYRLSVQLNQIALVMDRAELDKTTYGQDADDLTRISHGGLLGGGLSGSGFWKGGDDEIDDVMFDRFDGGGSDEPFTIGTTTGAEGTTGYSVKTHATQYVAEGQVGELLKVSFAAGWQGRVTRGTFLHSGSASSDVTGTAYELGAVSATQFLKATLHVMSGTGEFIVKVQSSSDEAFTSPNDRVTFSTILTGTAAAYEIATPVAGEITDTWWRAVATNPNTRDFVVFAGIQ